MDKVIVNMKLNIEEQISLLISKGIVIDDFEFAYKYLKSNNYYSIMKFRQLLYEKDCNQEYIEHKYKVGVTFGNLVKNYEYNLKLYYNLYEMLGEPIRYYKNMYIDFWVDYIGGFKQDKYLLKKYYRSSDAVEIISDILKKNRVKMYQVEHGFVPIWIVIDAMNEIQFCKLLVCSSDIVLKGVFLTEKVEKIKKNLEDIIWLCEERTPLLNEKHIVNCVGEFCKSIEKT